MSASVIALNPSVTTNAPRAAYGVDVSRGSLDGTVSRQWASRPHDQRFLTLDALHSSVVNRNQFCAAKDFDAGKLRVIASRDDADVLQVEGDGFSAPLSPTHWSFGQLSTLAGAPAGYLRELPAFLAAINLQYGLNHGRDMGVKLYANRDTRELRAATSPSYGRIFDHEVVEAVQRIVEASGGRWKVPGMIDWGTMRHNPEVNPTVDSTTLYASDRDVFMFLVDDRNPIEIGKLDSGDPDYVFRGFYAWNSEVGAQTFGLSTFLLRGVCMNRNIWGQQDRTTVKIKHSKHAPMRFAREAAPALLEYANASSAGILTGIQAAQAAVVARDDAERVEFLAGQGFGKRQAAEIVATHLREEGKPAASVWDFVNGITAVARRMPNTDSRLDLERVAGKLLKKAA